MSKVLPTVSVVRPDVPDWGPHDLIRDLIDMRAAARLIHTGPFVLCHGAGWGKYLDSNFPLKSGKKMTLLDRIMCMHGIHGVFELAGKLEEYDLLLVQVEAACEGKP